MAGHAKQGLLVVGLVALTIAGLWGAWNLGGLVASDAPRAAVPASGQALYALHCAACHGAKLEGQPDWHTQLPSGRLPAPPHDANGHTWHHADDILIRIVRDGTAAVVGGGYESDMPGFAEVLSAAEIDAILAFIKASWPARERAHQEAVSGGN